MKVGCDQHADLISKMENSAKAKLLWSTYFDTSSCYAQLHTQRNSTQIKTTQLALMNLVRLTNLIHLTHMIHLFLLIHLFDLEHLIYSQKVIDFDIF